MKYVAILLTFFVTLPLTSFSYGTPSTRFSIVYTNDVMGEVEPCG